MAPLGLVEFVLEYIIGPGVKTVSLFRVYL